MYLLTYLCDSYYLGVFHYIDHTAQLILGLNKGSQYPKEKLYNWTVSLKFPSMVSLTNDYMLFRRHAT